jgi:uncharacterized membrane protein YtjA (UPF0391 family)
MLRRALIFLVVAILAGVLVSARIAVAAAGIGTLSLCLFLMLFAISLAAGLRTSA